MSLPDRLRHIAPPSLRPLGGFARAHVKAAIVEELAGKRSFGGTSWLHPKLSLLSQPRLRSLPNLLIDDRRVLPLVDLPLVAEAADVNGVRQDLVERTVAEQPAAGLAARAVDTERQMKALTVERRLQLDDRSVDKVAMENLALRAGLGKLDRGLSGFSA